MAHQSLLPLGIDNQKVDRVPIRQFSPTVVTIENGFVILVRLRWRQVGQVRNENGDVVASEEGLIAPRSWTPNQRTLRRIFHLGIKKGQRQVRIRFSKQLRIASGLPAEHVVAQWREREAQPTQQCTAKCETEF